MFQPALPSLLHLSDNILTIWPSLIVDCIAVLVSFFLNLLVIVVLFLRRKKMEATDVFIIALAISDMMFSLAIHPMLIATSFGANSYKIFSSSGEGKVPDIIIL